MKETSLAMYQTDADRLLANARFLQERFQRSVFDKVPVVDLCFRHARGHLAAQMTDGTQGGWAGPRYRLVAEEHRRAGRCDPPRARGHTRRPRPHADTDSDCHPSRHDPPSPSHRTPKQARRCSIESAVT